MTDIFISYAHNTIMGSGLAITHLHSLLPRGWAEQGSLDTVKPDPGV
jgi:hypothetical protein